MLCCHLELPDVITGQLRTEERLEIDFDKAEYSRTFGGAVPPRLPALSLRATDPRRATQPTVFSRQHTVGRGADNSLFRSSRMLLHLTVEAEGCTKTLRLVESTTKVVKPVSSSFVGSSNRSTEMVRADQSLEDANSDDQERPRTLSRLESLDDPDVLYEVERKQPEQERKFQLDIGTIQISLIAHNEKMIRKEFMLICFEAIEFLAVETGRFQQLQLKVCSMQVDNNIQPEGEQLFPHFIYQKEVLNPRISASSGRTIRRKDFFNAHMRMRHSEDLSSTVIEKFEFLLQSAVLQMDDELIAWIGRFAECYADSSGSQLTAVHPIFRKRKQAPQTQKCENSQTFAGKSIVGASGNLETWRECPVGAKGHPVFIKELVMSPIDFEITFRTRVKQGADSQSPDEGGASLRGLKQLGLALSSVDKAAFRLNSLVITNIYGTADEISTVLYAQYRHRLMKNMVNLFLSTAAFGQMNLLAADIGTGVKDFFYKPIEGLVDGPIEGGKGLVIGTASLLGNTAKGAFGTASRIMNTVSRGLLFIAADEDFI